MTRSCFACLIGLATLVTVDPTFATAQGVTAADPDLLAGVRAVRHRERAEEELSKSDRALIAFFNEGPTREDRRFVNALVVQQKLWRKYAAAECEVAGSAMNAGDSPVESNAATECEAQLIARRAIQDKEALRCLMRAASWSGQDVPCLDALIPLVKGAGIVAGK